MRFGWLFLGACFALGAQASSPEPSDNKVIDRLDAKLQTAGKEIKALPKKIHDSRFIKRMDKEFHDFDKTLHNKLDKKKNPSTSK
jgi:hypothetical protein